MVTKAEKVILWLALLGILLIGIGLAICGYALNTMGAPWYVVQGAYMFLSGGFFIKWGINLLQRKV
jgi:hypothetical protein